MFRLSLLVLFAVGCATTPTTPDAVQQGSQAVAAEQPKLVCRWDQEIGSNVRRKVCVPADELDESDADAADDLRNMQNRTTRIQAPPPSPTGR